jgi:catechol 2,3-dioxygenase-like lactoylglutathione lyase family enzyme
MTDAPFRLSLLTLGVRDLAKAAAFYEALGMRRSSIGGDEVAFFDAGGVVLSLFDRGRLADEARVEDSPPGFGGFSLAFNVGSEAAVDEAISRAVAAGAKLLKPGHRAFWGGYIGYFADPEEHVWEVAHNPGFPLVGGALTLPP